MVDAPLLAPAFTSALQRPPCRICILATYMYYHRHPTTTTTTSFEYFKFKTFRFQRQRAFDRFHSRCWSLRRHSLYRPRLQLLNKTSRRCALAVIIRRRLSLKLCVKLQLLLNLVLVINQSPLQLKVVVILVYALFTVYRYLDLDGYKFPERQA